MRPAIDSVKILPGGPSKFFNSTARYVALFGGVGSSKTFTHAVKTIVYAYQYAGSRQLVTVPSSDAIRYAYMPVIREIIGEREGVEWMWNKGEREINFKNSSEVYLRSALVEDRLRGSTLAAVRMEEAAVGYQEEVYRILQARLRQPGYPHQLSVATTPKG